MVAKLDNPRVALVHQMPFTTDQLGLAHAIEKVMQACANPHTPAQFIHKAVLLVGMYRISGTR